MAVVFHIVGFLALVLAGCLNCAGAGMTISCPRAEVWVHVRLADELKWGARILQVRSMQAAASARLLSLRGGQDNEAEAVATTSLFNSTAGGAGGALKTARNWEDEDKDSRSSDEDDSNYGKCATTKPVVEDGVEDWDYGKFGMTRPVVEDGQSLNEQMTGVEGEPSYLASDMHIGKWGWTGLHRAACEGDATTLGKMLEMGGDPNVATHNGWTPLIEAASEGHTQCVELLVKFGANVTLPTKGGWSALHFAVGNGHLDTIKALLQLGADPLYQDSYGDYAMDKALRNYHMDWPTLPLHRSADMPVADRKELYWAAASLVNVTLLQPGGHGYAVNMSRFSAYAPLLPGRRYSYGHSPPASHML